MHFILLALMRLTGNLTSRGGEPRPDRDRNGRPILLYPLRPGIVVFSLLALLASLYILAANLLLLRHGGVSAVQPLRLAFALLLGPLAAVLLTRRLSLDDDGIHLHRPLGPDIRINWDELSHVERYQSDTAGRATFFIRSLPDPRTGRDRTLTLPEMTWNVPHLLSTVRERVPLPEQPRQRRHWYGG